MRSAVVAMLVAGSIAAPSARHHRHHHLHKAREANPESVVTETAYTTVAPAAATTQSSNYNVVTTVTVNAGQAAPTTHAAAPSAPVEKAAAAGPASHQSQQQAPPAAYGPVAPTGSAPAPPPAAPSSAAPSSSSAPKANGGFQQAALDAHNAHRANHSAPALTWDQGLADAAKIVAQRCHFSSGGTVDGHDTTVNAAQLGQYGQNMACGSDDGSDVANTIHSQWYNNEFPSYSPYFGMEPNWGTFSEWGHLSQVIWKGSTKVGCAVQDCGNGGVAAQQGEKLRSITFCNYGGPGNFKGSFTDNVLQPQGHPTVGKNAGSPQQENAGYTEAS